MSDNSYISSVFKSIGIMINEETKQEILYFFPLVYNKKNSTYYFKNTYSIINQPLGTFFTDFLNTNFNKKDDFVDFFEKYSFVILGMKYKNILIENQFTDFEFKSFIDKLYNDKSSKLIRIQEQLDEILDYCIINPRKRKNAFSALDRFLVLQTVHENLTLFRNNKMEFVTFYKICNEPISNKSENEIYKILENKNKHIKKYCVYIPPSIEALIYFILCNIVENKLLLKICKNCSCYFLTNNSKINYCNNIAPGFDKTCREIGVITSFKNTIENDELLKKYYKIYSKKAMLSRRNPDIIEYQKDFESYKKFGKNKLFSYKTGKISSEDFNIWLEKKNK